LVKRQYELPVCWPRDNTNCQYVGPSDNMNCQYVGQVTAFSVYLIYYNSNKSNKQNKLHLVGIL